MSINVNSVGLAGRLLLASFLPAQLPLVAVLIAYGLGASSDAILVLLVCAVLVSACLALWAVQMTLRPIRQVRRRLRDIVDANEIPVKGAEQTDESIVGALDQSVRELKEASTLDSLTDGSYLDVLRGLELEPGE